MLIKIILFFSNFCNHFIYIYIRLLKIKIYFSAYIYKYYIKYISKKLININLIKICIVF